MTAVEPSPREPLPSVLTIANLVYALHAFAIVVGIIGTATVVGSFVGSHPVDRRGDPQLREAQRRARHLGGVALSLADPDVLVLDRLDVAGGRCWSSRWCSSRSRSGSS